MDSHNHNHQTQAQAQTQSEAVLTRIYYTTFSPDVSEAAFETARDLRGGWAEFGEIYPPLLREIYSPVGTDTVERVGEGDGPAAVDLEGLYRAWQHALGPSSPVLRAAGDRSMSVGDLIVTEAAVYMVASIGFDRLSPEEAAVVRDALGEHGEEVA